MRKRHQRGSLAKVNGRWIAQWREDGRRCKRTLGVVSGMTKTEAQQALNQILAPINQGVGSPSTSDKLAHFIEGVFLPFYRRKWKLSTAITTENRLRKHLLADFGSRAVGSFNRNELQRWLERKAADGLSQQTIDHLRWDLSQVFRMAELEGSISRSPATLLYTPRAAGRTSTRRMNWKEVNLCLSVLDTRERLMAMLAVIGGMRTGEILALQWRHVFADRIEVVQRIYQRRIDTPKTRNSVRSVALSTRLREAIDSWRETAIDTSPDAWVFPSETGRTPVQIENIFRRNFRAKLEAVDLEWVTLQVMRRTHVSLMREMDVDPKLVADQLGHTLDVSLNVYAKLGLERRAKALELFESRLRGAALKAA